MGNGHCEESFSKSCEEEDSNLKTKRLENEVMYLHNELLNAQKKWERKFVSITSFMETIGSHIRDCNVKLKEMEGKYILQNDLIEVKSFIKIMQQSFFQNKEQLNEITSSLSIFQKKLGNYENNLMMITCDKNSGSILDKKRMQKSIDYLAEEINDIKSNYLSKYVTTDELHSALNAGYRESCSNIGHYSRAWLAANNSF